MGDEELPDDGTVVGKAGLDKVAAAPRQFLPKKMVAGFCVIDMGVEVDVHLSPMLEERCSDGK